MNETSKNEIRAIILEADGLIDDKHGYGYLIQKRLLEFGIKTKKLYLPDIAKKLADLPKKPLIISGGMTEVTANIEWINHSKRFIKKVIEKNQRAKGKEKQPLFGICFGAQLIAESFHKGSVTYLDDPEIGITKVTVDKKHKLFTDFPKSFPGYTFHYNQILPETSFSVLSANLHMGHHFVQAFEIPNSLIFGVQFHPEFLYEEFMALMKTYRKLISEELNLDYMKIIAAIETIESNAIMLKNFIELVS